MAEWKVDTGDQAPPWSATTWQGQEVSFPDVLAGKPAVVLFWATWCNYCRAFMPTLKVIQQDYADRGVQVLALNAKERGIGDPAAYLDELGFPVVGVLEADDIAAEYDIQFIPGLMVVDASGLVTYRRASTDLPPGMTLSKQWDFELRKALDAALAD